LKLKFKMKKLLIALMAITLTASSCKTVYSTTTIEAKKSFVLGDNEHDAFEVTLKNISKEDLELSQMPNGGTKQLIRVLNSDKSATIKIEKNTALYIENKSSNKASVELNLKSNTHLSMGYKN
jgi:selenocysteine lyase/cysteine desulfurase